MLHVSCRDHFHCASEPRLTRLSSDIRREPFLAPRKPFRDAASLAAKPNHYRICSPTGRLWSNAIEETTKTSHSTASVGRNCKSDIAMTAPGSTHTYEIRPRSDKRGVKSNFRCAAIRSAVVWRAKRSQQRGRPLKVLQPFT